MIARTFATTTTTTSTRARQVQRAQAVRGCGYHRHAGRRSRWKRTPRTRGARACVSPAPLAYRLRALAPPAWRTRVVDTVAGLAMAAGVATWGLAIALLG